MERVCLEIDWGGRGSSVLVNNRPRSRVTRRALIISPFIPLL